MTAVTILGLVSVRGGQQRPYKVRPTFVLHMLTSNAAQVEGLGYLSGTTGIDGDPLDPEVPDPPVQSIVRLYRDFDGRLIAHTVSDPLTGAWRFGRVNPKFTYTAIAYYNGYRAVVANGVKPMLPS